MSNTPIKVYYDPILNTIYNADGSSPNTKSTPKISLTQKSILNVSLVTKDDTGALIPFTDLPVSTAGEFLVDNDFSNPALTLGFATSGWVDAAANEYSYYQSIEQPVNIYQAGTPMVSGVIGGLNVGEWAYDDTVNIRCFGDVNPNTLSADVLTYDYDNEDYTPLFVFSNEFNESATWQDTDGTFRNPDIEEGELSFRISANTQNYYSRLGASASKTDTFAQIHLYDAAEIFMALQFSFICNNILLNDNDVNLDIVGINFYTKAEVDSLIQGYIPVVSGAVAGNAVALNANGTLYDVGFPPGTGSGGGSTVKVDANDPTADYLSGKFNTTQFESVSAGYYMQVRDGGLTIENIAGLSGELSGKLNISDADDNYMPLVLSGEAYTTELNGNEIFPINNELDQLKIVTPNTISDYVVDNFPDFEIQNGISTPSNDISDKTQGIHVVAIREKLSATIDHALLLHFDGSIGDSTFEDDGFYDKTVSVYGNPTIDCTLSGTKGFGSYVKLEGADALNVTSTSVELSADFSIGCRFYTDRVYDELKNNVQTLIDIQQTNIPVLQIGLKNGSLEYKIGVNDDTDWTNEDSVEVLDSGYLNYEDGNTTSKWNNLLYQQIGDELQVGLNGNVLARLSMVGKEVNYANAGQINIGCVSGYNQFLSGAIDEVTIQRDGNRLVWIEPNEGTPSVYEDWISEVNISKRYDVDSTLGADGSFRLAFTSGDVLTNGSGQYVEVAHTLNERLVDVTLMDNNYNRFTEDNIDYDSLDSCKVYIESYMPITDTWVLYVESGKNKIPGSGGDGAGVSTDEVNSWSKQQIFELSIDTTSTSAYIINFDDQQVLDLTLNQNINVTTINQIAGGTYNMIVRQDNIGNHSMSFGTEFKFASGTAPTLSTLSGSIDIMSMISDGTYLHTSFIGDFQ